MDVEYKYYEKGQNLEEVQAQIYNGAIKKYRGNEATVEQIKTRYQNQDFDFKSVRYAFAKDKTPLAYIQTRIDANTKRTFIGYPWAINNCPKDVQDKLFSEMLSYIKQRDSDHQIVLGNIQEEWAEVHDFAKKYNAKVDNEFLTYALEVKEMIKLDNTEFSMRLATSEDENNLAELARTEPGFDTAFANEDAMNDFFKDQVTNHEVLLIYKDNQLVSAGSLTSLDLDRNGRVNIRFTATRGYKFEYWRAFVIELSRYLASKGLQDTSFTIFSPAALYRHSRKRPNEKSSASGRSVPLWWATACRAKCIE